MPVKIIFCNRIFQHRFFENYFFIVSTSTVVLTVESVTTIAVSAEIGVTTVVVSLEVVSSTFFSPSLQETNVAAITAIAKNFFILSCLMFVKL